MSGDNALSSRGRPSESADEINFGVVSESPRTEQSLAAMCETLTSRVGIAIRPRVVRSFGELGARLASGDIDIAWTPPIAAVELELANKVSIAVGLWRGGGTSYSSALFTLESNPITKLGHLRGKRVAWVDRGSAAGYVFPKKKLESFGLSPEVLFSSQTFEGTHEAVVSAVRSGRADAGATYVTLSPGTGEVESAGWLRVEGAPVRVLLSAGPIPPDAIVIARRLDDSIHERVTEALLAAPSGEASAHVQTVFAGRAFTIVGSYQYDGLRSMLRVKPSASSSRRA